MLDSEIISVCPRQMLTLPRIIICLSVVGGVVVICLIWYGFRFYERYTLEEMRENRILSQPNQLLSASIPLQRPPFLRTQVQKAEGLKDAAEEKIRNNSLPLFRYAISYLLSQSHQLSPEKIRAKTLGNPPGVQIPPLFLSLEPQRI
jgi:hypothetical protein